MSLRDGLVALLGGSPFTVYDEGVPASPAARYAVLWSSAGVLSAQDAAHTPDLLLMPFQVTSVGRGPAEAEAVAADQRDRLVGNAPTASGWVAGPVEHVSSLPTRRDDDRPDESVFFTVDTYQVRAARA